MYILGLFSYKYPEENRKNDKSPHATKLELCTGPKCLVYAWTLISYAILCYSITIIGAVVYCIKMKKCNHRVTKVSLGRLHWCRWRMLETKCVGDKFEMLVTYLIHWENHQINEPNIMFLPPTSQIGHHHKVTNITISPTSLSPQGLSPTVY